MTSSSSRASDHASLHAASDAAHGHRPLTIVLHWLSAGAVAIAFAVAWTRASLDDPAPRAWLMTMHQSAGLFVLALLLARIGARLGRWREPAGVPLPPLMKVAALLTHLVLYLLLLAMPLAGWALANAHGHAVGLPGLPPLPTLAPTDPDLAETLEAWHVGIAWGLGGVVVLHALAALFHHFVRRDGVLVSMLPVAGPQPEPAGPLVRPAPQATSTF